jgi:RNA polymerase sigma-70 factor (ECF subfamily)
MKNEQEIIQAVIAGSDRYEELVQRYHVGLIIHCERMVKDRDDAEDIAQEAFVKAYLQLNKYNSEKSRFSTWLYKIATNLALDYLRKQKRKMNVDDVEVLAEATMPTYLEDEMRQTMRDAVKSLVPPEYRRVIEAYYWDGKSYQEIADAEGIPLNTTRTWIRRAKQQLKEKVA